MYPVSAPDTRQAAGGQNSALFDDRDLRPVDSGGDGDDQNRAEHDVLSEDIDANNSIPSTKIADATLIYVGDGQIASANVMGWLSRFFISSLWPF